MFETDGSGLDRAKAYEFLAGIFLKEPTPEVLNTLQGWAELSEESGFLDLIKTIQTQDPQVADLQQEYYDLFFVPMSGRFVPPFESAIRGASRQEGVKTKYGEFWNLDTTKMANLYEQTQFRPEGLDIFAPLKQLNLPDHVGYELSFMAYLCQSEEESAKKGQGTENIRHLEKWVLGEHLNRWLSLFTEDVSRVQVSGYYQYFVKLARDLCLEEEAALS